MSSELKPIKVWGNAGPNPPKVGMILEELGVPYEPIAFSITDVKTPEYLAINPNGRLPAIYDPNTDLTLWESGAIMEYLVEKYDKERRLSFPPGSPESYLAKQWLAFQISGQGPYYGQAVWFSNYHGEKIPSAIERYAKEVNRVTGVVEGHLAQQKKAHSGGDGPWLVGNKMSYADISWILWQRIIASILEKDAFNEDDYPLVKEWIGKMASSKGIKVALDRSDEVIRAMRNANK